MQAGGGFFVAGGFIGVQHAAAQGGGYAHHQFAAVRGSEFLPVVAGITLILRWRGQPGAGINTVTVEKNPAYLMAAGYGGAGKTQRGRRSGAGMGGVENQQGVAHG